MSDNTSLGSLYVVATPIGNLEDLTHRAETVLKSVQIVAAEDTRRTSVLLSHIGHRAPELISLHEHNETIMAPKLVSRLLAGEDVALVSDAGTPLVNDPGFVLVTAAHAAGVSMVPVPGSCSIVTALSVCPIPCQPFQFIGFLASKAGPRKSQIANFLAMAQATVFLESPKRIRATLDVIEAAAKTRQLMLGRELTKKFESLYVGNAESVLAQLDANPKGEFVCVVGAQADVVATMDEHRVMRSLLNELPPTQAARLGAVICGVKKSHMYDLAMSLTQE